LAERLSLKLEAINPLLVRIDLPRVIVGLDFHGMDIFFFIILEVWRFVAVIVLILWGFQLVLAFAFFAGVDSPLFVFYIWQLHVSTIFTILDDRWSTLF